MRLIHTTCQLTPGLLAQVLFALGLFSLVSANLYADTLDDSNENIDRACLKQAVALVDQLKSDVDIDMSPEQSEKILKLATATCKAEFHQSETRQAITEVENEKNPEDWFTKYILSGEKADKAGNKRLKRLK